MGATPAHQSGQFHRVNSTGSWGGEVTGGYAGNPSETAVTARKIRGYIGSNRWGTGTSTHPTVATSGVAGNLYDFGMQDGNAYTVYERPATWAQIRQVKLYAADNVAPVFTSTVQTPPWRDPRQSVVASARDGGMGVRRLQLQTSGGSEIAGTTHQPSCPATAQELCPFTVANVSFPLTNVASGTNAHRFAVFDAASKVGYQAVTLRVDRDKPAVPVRHSSQMDGEVPRLVLPTGGDAAQRKIRVQTQDGTSGVKSVSVKVDGNAVTVGQPSCSGLSCPSSFMVEIPADDLATGEHEVEVTVNDQVVGSGNPTIDADHRNVATVNVMVVNPTGSPRLTEPGLGFEDWWTYDSTDTGAGSTHRVNLASGNSLWSVTPVSNPGIGFDTMLRLTYNSLEPSGLLPGLLGDNGVLGYGVAGRGFSVQLGSITRLNEPLWFEGDLGPLTSLEDGTYHAAVRRIVLTDGDGTRHEFTRTSGDVAFTAPAGVHLHLRRFGGSDPERFWAATRPDGTTFFFDQDGYATGSEDRHENRVELVYRPLPTALPPLPSIRLTGCGYALVCDRRVEEVVDAAGLKPDGLVGVPQATPQEAATHRRWSLHYDDGNGPDNDPLRLIEVRDRKHITNGEETERRRTVMSYDDNGRLDRLTVAANGPSSQQREWELGWQGTGGSSTQFLRSVKDPLDNATTISYEQPSTGLVTGLLGPLLGWVGLLQDVRQVGEVEDRGGRSRTFRYVKDPAPPAPQHSTTWVRSARDVSSRFSMDEAGRLTQLVEDLQDTAAGDTGLDHLMVGLEQTWNDDVNAVASLTRGVQGQAEPYDYGEATTTKYDWGPLGQLRCETEQGGSLASPSGPSRRQVWKYAVHTGPTTLGGTGSPNTDQPGDNDDCDDDKVESGGGWVYDGRLERDREGKASIYDYGDGAGLAKGRLARVQLPGGAERQFDHDGRGLLTAERVRLWDQDQPEWADGDAPAGPECERTPGELDDGEPNCVERSYGQMDGNGDPRMRTDERGKVWGQIFDDVGNLLRLADPRANSADIANPAAGDALGDQTDPAGWLVGGSRESVRKNGPAFVARFAYDALDRQVLAVTPKRSAGAESDTEDRFRPTATTLDLNDNEKAVRDEAGKLTTRSFTATDQLEVETEPEAAHHVEPTGSGGDAWALGGLRSPVTRFAYDPDDNLLRRKDPVPSGDQGIGVAGRRSLWTYDRLGRPVVQVREGADGSDAQRKTISRAYDARDNVRGEVDARTNGDVDDVEVAIANAADRDKLRFEYEFDAFDRRITQIENPRTPALGDGTDVNRVTRWTFDNEDRETTERSPAGRLTKRHYDGRGDLIGLEEPFDHTPGASEPTEKWATTTIHRRRDGKPTEIISPRGHSYPDEDDDPGKDGEAFRTRFTYHKTGELHRRWLPQLEDQTDQDWRVHYQINDVGDPEEIRDARGKVFQNDFLDTGELAGTHRPGWWIYDPQGGGLRERTPDDPKPSATAGELDRDGLPTEPGHGDFGKVEPQDLPELLPLAGHTTFGYDDRLALTTVTGKNDAGSGTITQTLTYDELGRLTKRHVPLRAAGTVDPFPDGEDPPSALPTDADLEWQYDVRGNTRAFRALRRGKDGGDAITFWEYDAHDRLIKTTEPPNCQGTCTRPVTTFSHDRNDNRLTETLPSATNTHGLDEGAAPATGERETAYDAADRPEWTLDEFGARTSARYDLDDLVIKSYAPRAFTGGGTLTAPREQFATEYRHDGAGRVTWERRVVQTPVAQTLLTETTYDREGNPARIESPGARPASGAGEPPQRVEERLSDARGLVWKRTVGTGDERSTAITEFDGQGNLRRAINPKGVNGHGPGAEPMHPDGGDAEGTEDFTAFHATVVRYDEHQLVTGRALPWFDNDAGDPEDGMPNASGRQRWRQVYERSERGLVERITGVFNAKTGNGDALTDTTITRNLAGWPVTSTDRQRGDDGSGWQQRTDPLHYEYDQHGNQIWWSSDGRKRQVRRSFYPSGQLRKKCGLRSAAGDQEQVYSYRYDPSGALRLMVDWMHHQEVPPSSPQACAEGENPDVPDGNLGPRRTAIQRDKGGRPLLITENWSGGKDTRLRYVSKTPNLVESVQTDGTAGSGDGYTGGTSSVYGYDEQDRNVSVDVRDGGQLTGDVDRRTDLRWWPSGDRHRTLKPAVDDEGEDRTTDTRFYDSQGRITQRVVDPATGDTRTHDYWHDVNGNRTKDEKGVSWYNARDQLTEWKRKRPGHGPENDTYTGEKSWAGWVDDGSGTTELQPAKHLRFEGLDGAGQPRKITEVLKAPQPAGLVTTTIVTENRYVGDELESALRRTVGTTPGATPFRSVQLDCSFYNAFGSQSSTYRQTIDPDEPGASDPDECGDRSDPEGRLENRNVYDTFERLMAARARKHDEPDGSDVGQMQATEVFCYDGLDRRDRRVTNLTGALDPGAASEPEDQVDRAHTACTTGQSELGDAKAYDYSYLALTEQLTRESREGKVHTYEYTATGERLGRLKVETTGRQWRAYDTDVQGSVVGLEGALTGDVASADRYDTDPFGAPVVDEEKLEDEAEENPFRFQGFYKDQRTGTYDMQARAYRPETGRFLQQDRYENPQADLTLAADPLTSSRYAFVAGNPGTRAEYDGHFLRDWWEEKKRQAGDALGRAKETAGRIARDVRSGIRTGVQEARRTASTVSTVERRVVGRVQANPQLGAVGATSTARRPGGLFVTRVAFEGGGSKSVEWRMQGNAIKFGQQSAEGPDGPGVLGAAADVLKPCTNSLLCVLDVIPTPAKLLKSGKRATDKVKDAATIRKLTALRNRPLQLCSFGAATPVLMADGTLKPISEVRIGDRVITTDPKTGKQRKRRVIDTWSHLDRLRLLDVDGEIIHATAGHAFYNQTDREWQAARDLDRGDHVLTANGTAIPVNGLRHGVTWTGWAYNLTIAGEHNYHVGQHRILAHNEKCDILPKPTVSGGSNKLQNLVDNLYKGTTNPRRVGSGTTMDAIRAERIGRGPTGNKWHTTKGRESLRGLENWLRRHRDAPLHDRRVARSLADELRQVLGGGG